VYAERNHSFDPAVGFNEAFVAPSSEADMPVGDGNFDWEIPQLQTEEKTSGKIFNHEFYLEKLYNPQEVTKY
jgi:hypothetical protein